MKFIFNTNSIDRMNCAYSNYSIMTTNNILKKKEKKKKRNNNKQPLTSHITYIINTGLNMFSFSTRLVHADVILYVVNVTNYRYMIWHYVYTHSEDCL